MISPRTASTPCARPDRTGFTGPKLAPPEHGTLAVSADKITRSETDAESEYAIPFLKGYTVFNVEQIDGLPEHDYAKPAPRIDTIERAESFALFELKDDRRPAAERTAAGRVSGANFVCRDHEAGSLQPPLQVGGPQEGDGCDRRRYVRLAADLAGCDRCDEKRPSSQD
jgi:hypothetical protein